MEPSVFHPSIDGTAVAARHGGGKMNRQELLMLVTAVAKPWYAHEVSHGFPPKTLAFL